MNDPRVRGPLRHEAALRILPGDLWDQSVYTAKPVEKPGDNSGNVYMGGLIRSGELANGILGVKTPDKPDAG